MSINDEELRKLKGLLDDGIITQEEFETKKRELLNASSTSNTISNTVTPDIKHTQQRSSNNTTKIKSSGGKNKKGCGCLIVIILFLLFSINLGFEAEKKNAGSETNTNKNENAVSSKKSSKEDLKEFDNRSWEDFKEVYKNYNTAIKAMQNISDMNNYEIVKKAEDYFMTKSTQLEYGKTEDQKDQLFSLQKMCLGGQKACKYALKYLDSTKPSDLSKSKEGMDEATKSSQAFAARRTIFLKELGYSDQEIKNSLEELE